MFELCLDRDTWLHRLPAGLKLAILAIAGAAAFLVDSLPMLEIFVATALLVPLTARLPLAPLLRQLVGPALLIGGLAGFHLATGEPRTAALVAARLGTVILLAVALTATTRVSAMVEAIERGLRPFERCGVDPAKVGLTLSLAIRFIPVLFGIVAEIREAQKARGLERSVSATVIPLLVRTLRMADDLADAIAARGFDSE